ncbi:MAG: MotA/TolQ/ExbB proton channel family protein [Verrucomicrobiota bacterium]
MKKKTAAQRIKTWKIVLWASIAGVAAPPLFGLTGTALGMLRAFDNIGSTGLSDPGYLAEDISLVLVATAGALCVSAVSFVILALAVFMIIRTSKSGDQSQLNSIKSQS